MLGLQAVLLDLLGHQEPPRDLQLLVIGVAGDLNHFHPVHQRRRQVRQCVGRGDEQRPRQVVGDLHVMIGERVVLLRVQHLQQRRRRVAAEIQPQLVDLVQHEYRVDGAGAAHRLDDPPGQRTDVGPPVAANLGLVAHPAQRDALEPASHRLGDHLSQAGLAHARRTHEAQDGAAHPPRQLAHRQILKDAVLGLVEPEVAFTQHQLRVLDREPVAGALVPGHVQ